MSKSDREIDELIHQALSKEEADYFDKLEEQTIPQAVFGLFRGKNSWMNVVMVIVNLIVLGIAIYTFIEMLNTRETNTKMEWMFYTLICFMSMVLFKIWGWNQMDKNALMREIKRLEFQISILRKK